MSGSVGLAHTMSADMELLAMQPHKPGCPYHANSLPSVRAPNQQLHCICKSTSHHAADPTRQPSLRNQQQDASSSLWHGKHSSHSHDRHPSPGHLGRSAEGSVVADDHGHGVLDDAILLPPADAPNVDEASREEYRKLFENNRRWAAEKLAKNPSFFADLAKGQQPAYLLISCSDSRVPPPDVTQTQPGEIFIHRNIANVVANTDMNLMAVLQYAVEVLRVRHVIVMGHYECGGVKASLERRPHGLMDKWLANIKDVYWLHKKEVDAVPAGKERVNRLVELNVIEQVMNLQKTSIIQRAWALGQNLSVHGWVYDLHTGIFRDLEVERMPVWQEMQEVYGFEFTDLAQMLSRTPSIPLHELRQQSAERRKSPHLSNGSSAPTSPRQTTPRAGTPRQTTPRAVTPRAGVLPQI